MIGIAKAEYVAGYRIWLEFNTGESGEVDLSDIVEIFPAAASLKNIEQFKAFRLDDWPTLVWPNEFDLSPEMLYVRATGIQLPWLRSQEQTMTAS